mmetsp:Transcript_7927/g.11206  ORF Transcript_7927/g.11206 Transcript_7927/m.11206 type:complete len:86 (+) Transcript_7927:126-383(+)
MDYFGWVAHTQEDLHHGTDHPAPHHHNGGRERRTGHWRTVYGDGPTATRRDEDGFILSGWTEEGDEKKTRSGTDKSVTDRRTHLD